ncbi:MAG: hypothetical protein JW874_14010 [Spirochaetales bacterium]|nr:hypothetical protein [Spirochaetales bacterium]
MKSKLPAQLIGAVISAIVFLLARVYVIHPFFPHVSFILETVVLIAVLCIQVVVVWLITKDK